MKFVVLDEELPLEKIKFLQGKYRLISSPYDEEFVYDADESLRLKLKILEEAGFIQEVKKNFEEIESVSELFSLTERTELLQGGSAYMRVWIAGHLFSFTEGQLRTAYVFEEQLLRLKKVLRIKEKEWLELLQYWLDIAVEIKEPSEEDEITEKTMNYLCNCTIYKEKEKAVGPYVLFYNEAEPDRVYCHVDEMVNKFESTNRRRLRSILSPYIVSSSKQFRIRGSRLRFWSFDIRKCGIDMEKQLYEESKEAGKEMY